MWAVVFQAKATMPTVSTEAYRGSWTDKTTSQTKIPVTELKDTTLAQDRGLEFRGEVQGRAKGRRDRKRRKWDRDRDTERHCNLSPQLSIQDQPAHFQKGPEKEGAPCPLPTRMIKPRNQTVVCPAWDCNPQAGRWSTRTPVCRRSQPVPSSASLGGRKIKVRMWGQLDFQPLHSMRFEPVSAS